MSSVGDLVPPASADVNAEEQQPSRRQEEISSWRKEKISHLTSSEKKRYYKRRSAVRAYFTTEDSLEELSLRYHLSTEIIEKLARQCLMLHADGHPWGYRALLPGVEVIDHTPLPEVPVTPPEAKAAGEEDPCREATFSDVEPLPADVTMAEDPDDTTQREAIHLREDCTAGDLTPPENAAVSAEEQQPSFGQPATGEDVEDAQAAGKDTLQVADCPEMASIIEEEAWSKPGGTLAGTDVIAYPDDRLLEEQDETLTVVEEADAPPEEVVESVRQDVPPGPVQTPAMRSLVVREEMLPAAIARINGRPAGAISRQMLLARRSVRKNWVRREMRVKSKRSRRFIGGAVAAAMLLALLVPVVAGLVAYNTYSSIRGVALDGVSHLMAVKTLLPASKSDPTAVLNTPKLERARVQLGQAQSDFFQLQQLVNQPGIEATIQQYAPQYTGKIGMARSLVRVGIDVTLMGNELIGVALLGSGILHSSPLASGSTKPLVTVADVSNIEATLAHTLYYINDIRTQMSQISLNDLPISGAQKNELTSLLALLPKVQSYVVQAQGMIGLVSWLLGVGHQRRFLVQTMDRAELRPGGGFTGQYGIFQIQDGRMAPFTLQDVTELDYAGNGAELGRQAPPQYTKWMNFGNWGLRDSNLSGDFPTSAQLAMQVYQDEGGGPVDGDIAFTPVVIEHILDIIGPIKVPEYNETITAQNLEDKLHYYQQNQTAIILQQQKTGTHNSATRKAFTSLLGKLLLERVRQLPVPTLMKIAQNATKDIQARDLEIYFSDPQAEAWLVAHGYGGGMSSFSKQDGFMVVQANISINKASQYVHTTYQDAISLDAQGGATHSLTITLDYQQKGPVYGQNTYADYIRVYAPADAVFQSGDGFDTGKPICSAPKGPSSTGQGGTGGKGVKPPPPKPGPPPCSQAAASFPSNERYCPDGNYNLSGPNSFVPGKGFMPWPVDSLGPPTQMTSDLPGRAMWGGLTVTPMNCTSTITLSWYVPNAVKHIHGQPLYSLLVQKQGGYVPTVQISIDTSQLKGVKPFSFQGDLTADRTFALQVVKK